MVKACVKKSTVSYMFKKRGSIVLGFFFSNKSILLGYYMLQ